MLTGEVEQRGGVGIGSCVLRIWGDCSVFALIRRSRENDLHADAPLLFNVDIGHDLWRHPPPTFFQS